MCRQELANDCSDGWGVLGEDSGERVEGRRGRGIGGSSTVVGGGWLEERRGKRGRRSVVCPAEIGFVDCSEGDEVVAEAVEDFELLARVLVENIFEG
jgi:hypothetical protein